ncbi:MAG: hypothetical protein HY578_02210 [Nitrospinae bacterium]|nr:hypothetical protein [Nitrospinota bacterium]
MRAYCCLKDLKIKTVGELIQRTENELLRAKNFGRKSSHEIKEALNKFGLRLGMKIPDDIVTIKIPKG